MILTLNKATVDIASDEGWFTSSSEAEGKVCQFIYKDMIALEPGQ